MKATKMTFKIILALALPLSSIAGSSDDKNNWPTNEAIVEQAANLKIIGNKLNQSAATIQTLNQIADPSLISLFSEIDKAYRTARAMKHAKSLSLDEYANIKSQIQALSGDQQRDLYIQSTQELVSSFQSLLEESSRKLDTFDWRSRLPRK